MGYGGEFSLLEDGEVPVPLEYPVGYGGKVTGEISLVDEAELPVPLG